MRIKMRSMDTVKKPKFNDQQVDAVLAWLADPSDKRTAEEVINDWYAEREKGKRVDRAA